MGKTKTKYTKKIKPIKEDRDKDKYVGTNRCSCGNAMINGLCPKCDKDEL